MKSDQYPVPQASPRGNPATPQPGLKPIGPAILWLGLATSLMGASAQVAAQNGIRDRIFGPVATGAQPVVPSQFDVVGTIQMATLDTANHICTPTDPRLAGGLVTVNGVTITIPCNTILQMPAAALTWAELFDPAMQPANVAARAPARGYNTITGLALADAAYLSNPPLTGGTVDQPYPGALPMAPTANLTNLMPATGGLVSAPFPLLPSYQIHIQGNIMPNGEYIAGLVFISQDFLNAHQGFIKSIDYATGELCVASFKPAGGFAPQTVPSPPCSAPDARVRPADGSAVGAAMSSTVLGQRTGRYGLSHGKPDSGAEIIEANFDPRFTVDQDNPTLHAETGYPMCIPRSFPFTANGILGQDDPLCPQANRPIQVAGGGKTTPVKDSVTGAVIGSRGVGCQYLPPANGRPAVNGINFPNFPAQSVGSYCHSFVMDETPNYGGCGTLSNGVSAPCTTRPDQQAPFEVGDYITYSGTLTVDGLVNGLPMPGANPANPYYVSAHTIAASLGIYTYPGKKPVYVTIEEMLAGTNGQALPNIPQEATSRVGLVGFVTDPSAIVDIFAMDVDQLTGVTNDRLLANSNPAGPPVIGRVKFQPAAGAYPPATRNMRIVSRALCNSNTLPCYYPQAGGLNPITGEEFSPAEEAANGLKYGQYNAPNFEFIFPENLSLGDQIVPNNLQDLAFLYCGSGPLTTPTAPATGAPVVGPLNPSPWAAPMPAPVNPFNTKQALCSSNLAVVGGLPGGVPVVANQPKDTVTILNVSWDNRRGQGKLTITAVSSLQTVNPVANPPTPNNLQLYVEAYDWMGVGMSSNPVAMNLINQQTINGALVCGAAVPTGGQCFQYTTTGAILDPVAAFDFGFSTNQFAYPAVGEVTPLMDPFHSPPQPMPGGIRVSSSRGGIGITGQAGQAAVIRLRCNALAGFTC